MMLYLLTHDQWTPHQKLILKSLSEKHSKLEITEIEPYHFNPYFVW